MVPPGTLPDRLYCQSAIFATERAARRSDQPRLIFTIDKNFLQGLTGMPAGTQEKYCSWRDNLVFIDDKIMEGTMTLLDSIARAGPDPVDGGLFLSRGKRRTGGRRYPGKPAHTPGRPGARADLLPQRRPP